MRPRAGIRRSEVPSQPIRSTVTPLHVSTDPLPGGLLKAIAGMQQAATNKARLTSAKGFGIFIPTVFESYETRRVTIHSPNQKFS